MISELQWSAIAALIAEWWPGEFSDDAERAWFIAVEAFDAQHVTDALRALLMRGSRFRPSVAELLGELRADPSAPTFPRRSS